MQFSTLADIIARRRHEPIGINFIDDHERTQFLSYGELHDLAAKGLSALQDAGLKPKDELVFQIENNKTFVIVFWACVLGGIIPVPLSVGNNDEHKQKLFNVWSVLNNPHLISSAAHLEKLKEFANAKRLDFTLNSVIDEAAVLTAEREGRIMNASEDDIAFIQFSSGSTGSPKGVVLTHRNLLANMDGIARGAGYSAQDSTLSWMPLTHDMGLIGFHLSPLFSGMQQYLIPTPVFVRMPALWLAKASEHRVTVLSSPNFGYKYFLKHCSDPASQGWDLSAVRIIYNGAEPIAEQVCYEFLDSLAPCGLKRNAMCPVYGLAEASVAVSMSRMEDEVISVSLNRNKLNFGEAIEIKSGDTDTVSFVNVGKAIAHCAVRIVDNSDGRVGEGIIGNIQIIGENVTSGYYNNAAESAKVLTADGWLRTGDLGFIYKQCLYVTGRAKDIIFVNGQNYYPHDIERVAEAVPGIELNRIAVGGFFNNDRQKEQVIAFVFFRDSLEKFVPLAQAVQARINQEMGFMPDSVLPVRDIPRTTSGKLQRFRLLEQYQNGQFKEVEQQLQLLTNTAQQDITLPANEQEQKLSAIVQRVLGVTELSVTTNFLAAGVNSLKAAEIVMQIWKECNVLVDGGFLYTYPTIRQLAGALPAPAKQYMAIPTAHETEYYPVTSAQKRLYYAWRVDPSSIAYNVPVAVRMHGHVDLKKLETCIRQLVQRHDSLRMSFHQQPEPCFKIHAYQDFTLEVINCRETELDKILKGLVRPFHLERTPLFRIKLLRTETGSNICFLDFHHIIADGISIYNFLADLASLYHQGKLPVLAVQYRDYACWEHESIPSKQSHHYWKAQLQGEWPLLEMPLDLPRPVVFNSAGEKIAFEFPAETHRKLQALAAAESCSMHALLFTLFNLLLSKYTGQTEIVVGIPVSGRRHPDVQGMMGMFVNNLAIRSTIGNNDCFVQLLQSVKTNLNNALQHQDYPFEKMIEAVNDRRDVSRNFVFDTMFIYQNMGLPPGFSRQFFDPGFSKYDISLEVFEEGSYAFEYATALFTKETVNRIAMHFHQLVEAVIQNPQAKLAGIQMLSNLEFNRFIYEFNETASPCPNKLIHELFEQQVLSSPGAIAIDHEGNTLTYAELNSQANDLANLLREKGMKPQDLAAIWLDRSPQFIISVLAVSKAGGCYLPIDTDLPEERALYLISDSQCAFLLTGNRPLKKQEQATVINVQQLQLRKHGIANLPLVNQPTDLAYVLYTSGTTGKPKGVMIEHRSLVNYITWAANSYTRQQPASFPLFTSVSFDLTVTSIFTPLITGGTIVIYEEDGKRLLIERIITANKVNIIKLTPSHLKILAEKKFSIPPANKVHSLVVGGEQLETRLAKSIYDKFHGHISIYNEYGPTETTVGCMIYRFDPKDQMPSVPIGVPAQNTQIYLLDRFLQPVPAGARGEIYIGGSGVARGYLFKDELTREKFLPDPFNPGHRIYRTGDIARRNSAGIIEYVGRYDQQVKINGYRIELAEIESHLLSYPGVTEALATVRTNAKNQQIICAYYKSRGKTDNVAWRNFLSARLPHYMIPVHFISLSEIPLTRNGKVNYNALPAPEHVDDVHRVDASNDIERAMIKVWEGVLGVQNLSITDNFFALGGDSIKAVQITSRLHEQGIQVQVKHILTFHTIQQVSQQAVLVNNQEQKPATGEKPLSFIDKWFFSQQFSNPGFYNQSLLLELHAPVDKARLQQAFETLVRHHDGLRLNYDPVKKTMFYNERHLSTPFIIEEEPNTSFDITSSLLIKAAIINNKNLFLTAHHLAVDGISWRILLEDLYKLLQGHTQLPAKTASLAQWEQSQAELAEAEEINTRLPLDIETADWRMVNCRKHTAVLDKTQTSFLLQEALQTYKTDIQTLLVAALGLTLKEWTAHDHIVIELESHGRNAGQLNVSRTVGWFTIIHPLTLQLEADSPAAYIRSVKQQLQQAPSRAVRNHAGKKPSQIRFNYLGQFGTELNNDLFSYVPASTGLDTDPENTMTACIEINCMIIQEVLQIEISYNQKAHAASTIQWCCDTLLKNLSTLIAQIQNPQEMYFVPADFDSVQLDEGDLKVLFE
jgi:amino acid adenylation domain-containing protein/non-ribosomal peptide synthase protein (TIGR01720 family)